MERPADEARQLVEAAGELGLEDVSRIYQVLADLELAGDPVDHLGWHPLLDLEPHHAGETTCLELGGNEADDAAGLAELGLGG